MDVLRPKDRDQTRERAKCTTVDDRTVNRPRNCVNAACFLRRAVSGMTFSCTTVNSWRCQWEPIYLLCDILCFSSLALWSRIASICLIYVSKFTPSTLFPHPDFQISTALQTTQTLPLSILHVQQTYASSTRCAHLELTNRYSQPTFHHAHSLHRSSLG